MQTLAAKNVWNEGQKTGKLFPLNSPLTVLRFFLLTQPFQVFKLRNRGRWITTQETRHRKITIRFIDTELTAKNKLFVVLSQSSKYAIFELSLACSMPPVSCPQLPRAWNRLSCLLLRCQNEATCEMRSAYWFIFTQIKLIFIWKVLHEDSFWKRGDRQYYRSPYIPVILAIRICHGCVHLRVLFPSMQTCLHDHSRHWSHLGLWRHSTSIDLRMGYWPSVRSRWLDIGQVPLLRVYGLRRSRGP